MGDHKPSQFLRHMQNFRRRKLVGGNHSNALGGSSTTRYANYHRLSKGEFPARRCKISGRNRRDDAMIVNHSTNWFPVPRGTSGREDSETRCATGGEVTRDQLMNQRAPTRDSEHGDIFLRVTS